MSEHLIGLLLGTEEDWPRAFEALVGRLGPVRWRGEEHRLTTERIVNEPFDLRAKPRYSLVIDRLAWWYDLPREWLKKISLGNDVYLLNNPFTFQAMEKHAAYCAMIRLGLRVPETWMVPHKKPPDNPRFPITAQRYLRWFDLALATRGVAQRRALEHALALNPHSPEIAEFVAGVGLKGIRAPSGGGG